MAFAPGSRPRSVLTRPYARSVHLSFVDLVLVRRWATARGLSIGAALRELISIGLRASAPEHERDDWDTTRIEVLVDHTNKNR